MYQCSLQVKVKICVFIDRIHFLFLEIKLTPYIIKKRKRPLISFFEKRVVSHYLLVLIYVLSLISLSFVLY